MRSWARQGFLNPPDSNDSGWFKFSIRKRKVANEPNRLAMYGYSLKFAIADCSKNIELDFEPEWNYTDTIYRKEDGSVSKEKVRGLLGAIAERRRKVDTLADAVVGFQKAYNASLDEFEAELRAIDLTGKPST